MKKILLICNTTQNIYNFRLPLIKNMISANYLVETISFDEKYSSFLKDCGVKNHCVNGDNRSINPFKTFSLKKRIKKTIGEIKPDIVFTFTAKPNIYGTICAHKIGVKSIYCMVEGAGDPFIKTSLKWRLIKKIECFLFRRAFRYAKKIFFLNEDDKKEFVGLKLLSQEKAIIIDGIGVDLDKFKYSKVNCDSSAFVMVARMLKTKGVFEYCECARIVKKEYPNARFLYLGSEGDVKVEDIKEFIENGEIEYLGNVTDVRPFLESSILMILPSYREGKPMSIMEAEAIGRGIITTTNVGCKDMVIDGYNGFLVEHKDFQTMAIRCKEVLSNRSIIESFGKNSRLLAEKKFDQKKINAYILECIDENNSCA